MSPIILFVVFAAAAAAAVAHSTRDPVTFLYGNSYLQYYKWTAPNYGRVELHFKTSQPNATVLYIAGQGHHVYLSLFNGKMKCTAQLSTYQMNHTALQYWNDDQWHKTVLTHKLGKIQVTVDSITQATLQDQHVSSLETGFSPLYIGGVPMTVSSNFTSFQGCIKGLKIANFTLLKFRAKYVSPVYQNNTQPGCNGPCELNHTVCNDEETCVGNWSTGKTICKCNSIGKTCTQNLTGGVLNGSSYQCYHTTSVLVPYIPSYLSVELKSPIPSNGVIISNHGVNLGGIYSNVLYLQNYKLHYGIHGEVSTTFNTKIVLSLGKDYLISIAKKKPFITVTVADVNNTVSETIEVGEFIESQKELVCIGGGSVGIESYKGTVLGVNQEGLQVSLPVIYLPTMTSVYIGTLEKQYLPLLNTLFTNGHIQFKVWTDHPGSLMYVQSIDYYSLDIQLYPGEVALTWNELTYSCFNRNIITNRWLLFELNTILNILTNEINALQVTVNNFHCVINESNFINNLKHLDGSILYLGSPLIDNNDTVTFRGHIDNLTITQGSPLQLNVKSLIDEFSLDSLHLNNTTEPQSSPSPLPATSTSTSNSNECYMKPTKRSYTTTNIPSSSSSLTLRPISTMTTPSPSNDPLSNIVPKVFITSTKYHHVRSNQDTMVFVSFGIAAFVIVVSIAGILFAMSWYIVKMMHMKRERAKLCKTNTVAFSKLVTSEVTSAQEDVA